MHAQPHEGALSTSRATARLIAALDRCLPQTQCTRCGYPCCREYATAMAEGRAAVNRCPPGGAQTIAMLSSKLGTPPQTLAADVGAHQPRSVALIDESRCIGCALCTPVCPVDAIIGAPKQMHSVLRDHCTGCELCLAPCPMDCITMLPVATSTSTAMDNSPLTSVAKDHVAASLASSAWHERNARPFSPTEARPWPGYSRTEAKHFRALKRRRDKRLAKQNRAHQRAMQSAPMPSPAASPSPSAKHKPVQQAQSTHAHVPPPTATAIRKEISLAVTRTRARRMHRARLQSAANDAQAIATDKHNGNTS